MEEVRKLSGMEKRGTRINKGWNKILVRSKEPGGQEVELGGEVGCNHERREVGIERSSIIIVTKIIVFPFE